MKRPSLKKLMTVLLVLFVLGGAGAYFGGKYFLKRRAEGWLRDGIAASIAGNHERAVFFLKGYLLRDPAHTEALKHYVISRELLVDSRGGLQFTETVNALKVLIGQDPNSPEGLNYRRHLLELYVKLERIPEALDTSKALLDKLPGDARTLELRTGLLRRFNQLKDAFALAQRWVAAAPLSLRANMEYLYLLGQTSQSADAVVDKAQMLYNANPKNPKFEFLLGFGYVQGLELKPENLKRENREPATKWFQTAAKHPGMDEELVKSIAEQFDNLAMTEDSMAVIQAAVKGGAGVELRHMLARRLWQANRWGGLVDVLSDLDQADPKTDATLIAFKQMALIKTGNGVEAKKCFAALSARDKFDILKSQYLDPAASAWTLLLQRDAGNPVDDKSLVEACEQALRIESDNTYLRYFLGEARFRMGEMDKAAQSWLRAAIQNPNWAVPAVRLVDGLIERGKHAQAYRFAMEATRRNPHNAAVVISFARAWAAGIETGDAGESDELLKLVADIQRQIPGEEKTFLIQLQLLAKQGSKTEAIKLARAALMEQTPPPSERRLLTIASISRQFDLAVDEECFNASEKIYGITPELAYVKAASQSAPANSEQALKLFDGLAKKSGHAEGLAWQLSRVRLMETTNHPAARGSWIELAGLQPDNLVIQLAAVRARSLQGDWIELPKIIDRLKPKKPDPTSEEESGLEWKLAYAHLRVDYARTDADYEIAATELVKIIKVFARLPEAHALLALANEHLKRMDGAIKHMTEATNLDEGSIPYALELARMLQTRGDYERARQELARITPRISNAGQRQQVAFLLAKQGDLESAKKILQDTRDQAGKPVEGLLLAMLFNRDGDFQKAEGIVQKLLDQKPDLATIQFAASMYAAKDRRADAERVLARMDALQLEPGVKEMMWASYHSQLGELSEAARHFATATQQVPANPVVWRSLVTCQLTLGKYAEARQSLADGLKAVSGDDDLTQIEKQFDLLQQSMRDDDLRSVAISFLRDPTKGDIALKLLENVTEARRTKDMTRLSNQLQEMARDNPKSISIQLQQIRCMAEMQSIGPAITLALRATSAFPEEEEPARLATRLCALDQRWDQMLTSAQVWRKRAVMDAFAADVAIAQAQIKSNSFDAAYAQLQPHLSAAIAQPNRRPDVLIAAAIALAGGDKIDEATNLLWPLAQKEPVWRKRWIEAGVEFSDRQKAVAWLDRVAEIIPVDGIVERVILAEGYEQLGRRFGSPELVQKGTDSFVKITADPKVNAMALLAAGAHAERCNTPIPAAEYYRRAIAMDDTLWIAKNNLAMLLIRSGGDPKLATAMAKDAVRLQPQRSEVHDTLAAAEASDGHPDQAVETIGAALLLEPNNVKWLASRIKYLLAAGKASEAKKELALLDAGHLGGRGIPAGIKTDLDAIRIELKKAPK